MVKSRSWNGLRINIPNQFGQDFLRKCNQKHYDANEVMRCLMLAVIQEDIILPERPLDFRPTKRFIPTHPIDTLFRFPMYDRNGNQINPTVLEKDYITDIED